MSHTYTCLLTHIVFSTKDRFPFLARDVRPRVQAFIGGIVKRIEAKPLVIGGVEDHIHMLVELPAKVALSDALSKIKSGTSGWIKDEWPAISKFAWQTGYSAFSVSRSNVSHVARYIEQQEEHHRHVSFQEELLDLLRKHGIDYDERFIWA